MKYILSIILLSFSLSASAAEMSARMGKDYILISDAECASKLVLDKLPVGSSQLFRKAEATVDGKNYKACWTATTRGIELMYEDGDIGIIPPSAFKPVDTI